MMANSGEISELLEGALERVCKTVPHDNLIEQVRYGLFPGGKRIRPRVLLTVAQALGAELSDDLFLVASSLELIHTASLIHDDLPSVDNDEYRRGKPAFHVQYGEGEAVLVGDLLYALAFKALSQVANEKVKTEALSLLSQANTDVQLGQILDIQNVSSPKELKEVHRLKTASLFRAAATLGFLFRDESVEVSQETVEEFGLSYGVYFQARNDLADPEQTELFARASGSDLDTGRGSVMQWSEEERQAYVAEMKGRATEAAKQIVNTDNGSLTSFEFLFQE